MNHSIGDIRTIVCRVMTTFGIIEIRIDLFNDLESEHAYRVLGAIFNPPEAEVEFLKILKPLTEALKRFFTKQYPEQILLPSAPQTRDEKPRLPGKPEGGV